MPKLQEVKSSPLVILSYTFYWVSCCYFEGEILAQNFISVLKRKLCENRTSLYLLLFLGLP